MSSSIYNVPLWATATPYSIHDIVKNDTYYYYGKIAHTSTVFATDLADLKWGGRATDDNGVNQPEFIWTPAYNDNDNLEPRVIKNKFGDGYEQRVADGINNILLEFDYTFEDRTLAETAAILHFLHQRKAVDCFLFTPPVPFNQRKKFVCPTWNKSIAYYNNYTIRAKFVEVPA